MLHGAAALNSVLIKFGSFDKGKGLAAFLFDMCIDQKESGERHVAMLGGLAMLRSLRLRSGHIRYAQCKQAGCRCSSRKTTRDAKRASDRSLAGATALSRASCAGPASFSRAPSGS